MANSPTDPARDLLAWALEAGEDAIAATLGARAVKATRPTTAERLAALRVCAQLASDAAIDDDMAEAEATARAHRAVTAETDAATDQRAHGWAELLANHTARARKAFARAAEIGADTRVGVAAIRVATRPSDASKGRLASAVEASEEADQIEAVVRFRIQRAVAGDDTIADAQRLLVMCSTVQPPWHADVARAVQLVGQASHVAQHDTHKGEARAVQMTWLTACEAALPDPNDPRRGRCERVRTTLFPNEAVMLQQKRLARVLAAVGDDDELTLPVLWPLSHEAKQAKAHAIAIDAIEALDVRLARKRTKKREAAYDRRVVLSNLLRTCIAKPRLSAGQRSRRVGRGL